MASYQFSILLIIGGLILLIAGGEVLIRGATALAGAFRIPPLVIGLTVVAFGTSAPELAVSIQSAWSGRADLAVGNVVGSNIANILLILGLSALIAPLVVASQLIRLDVPLMIIASCAVLVMGWDGNVGRPDGALLFAALIGYTTWLIRQSRHESPEVQTEFASQVPSHQQASTKQLLGQMGMILLGLVLLAGGSRWLVQGAAHIARLWGVQELIIGLTVVAIGTSLPEVVTSVVASLRGQRDIAVGNVVGSNLFNILCVLGLTSIVSPAGITVAPAVLRFDLPIMIVVAAACLPIFFTGNRIARWEGGLFLSYYIVYVIYLVCAATEAAFTRTFGLVMSTFVIPLTLITLLVCVVRAFSPFNKVRDDT